MYCAESIVQKSVVKVHAQLLIFCIFNSFTLNNSHLLLLTTDDLLTDGLTKIS